MKMHIQNVSLTEGACVGLVSTNIFQMVHHEYSQLFPFRTFVFITFALHYLSGAKNLLLTEHPRFS